LKKEPLEMVSFAADHERAGPGLKVLAEYAGKPALVQRDHILAATFHPELTDDTTVHEHFLELVAGGNKSSGGQRKVLNVEKEKKADSGARHPAGREFYLCAWGTLP